MQLEKVKQHYALANIKAAFADPSRIDRSFVSRQDTEELDMDDANVIAVIQALTVADFKKSMPSIADHKIWQDFYKPNTSNKTLYVKFTLDARGLLFLISFKEA